MGVWSIPKGEAAEGESLLDRAKIEFLEETGKAVDGNFIELMPITQKAGKKVFAWALEQDVEISGLISNIITINWPPKSGISMVLPEVDRWEWFSSEEAKQKINPAQAGFIVQLEEILSSE